jgi:hypothetical protein
MNQSPGFSHLANVFLAVVAIAAFLAMCSVIGFVAAVN